MCEPATRDNNTKILECRAWALPLRLTHCGRPGLFPPASRFVSDSGRYSRPFDPKGVLAPAIRRFGRGLHA